MNEEVMEESPYQVYLNIYCTECSDEHCIVKRKEAVNKKMTIHGKELVLPRNDIREAVWRCAKLRDLMRNYYKD